MSVLLTYRGWAVRNDNPPAPASSSGWSATSPDYDVDCDGESFVEVAGQQVHAPTYDALVLEIDAAIEESDYRARFGASGNVAPESCPTCGALPCDWTDRPTPAAFAVADMLSTLDCIEFLCTNHGGDCEHVPQEVLREIHTLANASLTKVRGAAIDEMALAPVACRRCGCSAMALQKRGQWAVECNNDGTLGCDVATCGAVGPTEATEAEAVAAWNEGNTPTGGAA